MGERGEEEGEAARRVTDMVTEGWLRDAEVAAKPLGYDGSRKQLCLADKRGPRHHRGDGLEDLTADGSEEDDCEEGGERFGASEWRSAMVSRLNVDERNAVDYDKRENTDTRKQSLSPDEAGEKENHVPALQGGSKATALDPPDGIAGLASSWRGGGGDPRGLVGMAPPPGTAPPPASSTVEAPPPPALIDPSPQSNRPQPPAFAIAGLPDTWRGVAGESVARKDDIDFGDWTAFSNNTPPLLHHLDRIAEGEREGAAHGSEEGGGDIDDAIASVAGASDGTSETRWSAGNGVLRPEGTWWEAEDAALPSAVTVRERKKDEEMKERVSNEKKNRNFRVSMEVDELDQLLTTKSGEDTNGVLLDRETMMNEIAAAREGAKAAWAERVEKSEKASEISKRRALRAEEAAALTTTKLVEARGEVEIQRMIAEEEIAKRKETERLLEEAKMVTHAALVAAEVREAEAVRSQKDAEMGIAAAMAKELTDKEEIMRLQMEMTALSAEKEAALVKINALERELMDRKDETKELRKTLKTCEEKVLIAEETIEWWENISIDRAKSAQIEQDLLKQKRDMKAAAASFTAIAKETKGKRDLNYVEKDVDSSVESGINAAKETALQDVISRDLLNEREAAEVQKAARKAAEARKAVCVALLDGPLPQHFQDLDIKYRAVISTAPVSYSSSVDNQVGTSSLPSTDLVAELQRKSFRVCQAVKGQAMPAEVIKQAAVYILVAPTISLSNGCCVAEVTTALSLGKEVIVVLTKEDKSIPTIEMLSSLFSDERDINNILVSWRNGIHRESSESVTGRLGLSDGCFALLYPESRRRLGRSKSLRIEGLDSSELRIDGDKISTCREMYQELISAAAKNSKLKSLSVLCTRTEDAASVASMVLKEVAIHKSSIETFFVAKSGGVSIPITNFVRRKDKDISLCGAGLLEIVAITELIQLSTTWKQNAGESIDLHLTLAPKESPKEDLCIACSKLAQAAASTKWISSISGIPLHECDSFLLESDLCLGEPMPLPGICALSLLLSKGSVAPLRERKSSAEDSYVLNLGDRNPPSQSWGIDHHAMSLLSKGLTQVAPSLTKLKIQDNNIGRRGAKWLAECFQTEVVALTLLNGSGCNFGDEGCEHLAKILRHGLEEIDLSKNKIGPSGAKVIAKAMKESKNSSCTSLNLSQNLVGDSGVASLSRAFETALSLRRLDLSGNANISHEGIKALVKGLQKSDALQEINLSRCQIGEQGFRTLAHSFESRHANPFCLLELNACKIRHIDPKAFEILCTVVKDLRLGKNSLGDQGAANIAQILDRAAAPDRPSSQLTVLDISNNSIGPEGGRRLIECLKTKNASASDERVSTSICTLRADSNRFESYQIEALGNLVLTGTKRRER